MCSYFLGLRFCIKPGEDVPSIFADPAFAALSNFWLVRCNSRGASHAVHTADRAPCRARPQSTSNMTPGQYWQGGFGAYLEQGYARNMQRSRRHLPRMRFRLMYARSAWPGDTATGAATASGRRASGCPSRRARRAPPPTRFCTCSRALNDTRAAALTIVIVLRLTQLQERAARRAGRHGPPGRTGGGDAGQGARWRQAQQALVLLTLFSVAISLFSGQLRTAVWCSPFEPVAPSHPRSFLSHFLYTTVCKRFTRSGEGGRFGARHAAAVFAADSGMRRDGSAPAGQRFPRR